MNLIVICHLDVNVMTNEFIVVEFVCIFLLKDKAIDKNAWVVDMKVETTKMFGIVGTSWHHPHSLLTCTLTSLILGKTLNMSLIMFLVD